MVDYSFLSELTAEDVYREHQRPKKTHKLFGWFGFQIRNHLKNGASNAERDIFSNGARIFFINHIAQYHWVVISYV